MIRGALRRRIAKFERPKSLFGKKTYVQEQAIISDAVTDMYQGAFTYSSKISKLPEPAFIPKKKRQEKARFYFRRAKKRLNSIL